MKFLSLASAILTVFCFSVFAESEPRLPEPLPEIIAEPLTEPLAETSTDDVTDTAIEASALVDETVVDETSIEVEEADPWGPFKILNTELSPNSMATLSWYSGHFPGGFDLGTPVIVIHGKSPGPTVCLTAAVHGDEVNGVEIARRVVDGLKPENIKGTIISVPVVNIDGLWRKDRYMSDRRDLNRAFPGSPQGPTASRVAYSLFTSIIRHCDSLIDLHSGSMFRENITQLRADLSLPEVAQLAAKMGGIPVLQSLAPSGSLRGAATAYGIPAVVMEVGGPYTVDVKLVDTGVKAVRSYLSQVEMLPRSFFWSSPQPVFYASHWLRSRDGGILINKVELGQKVNKGQLLGVISNPTTDHVEEIKSPYNGLVLGRAQNQFVSAGYAIYNLGERRAVEELEQQAEQVKKQVAAQTAEQLGIPELKPEPKAEAATDTDPDSTVEGDNSEALPDDTQNDSEAAVKPVKPVKSSAPIAIDPLLLSDSEDNDG